MSSRLLDNARVNRATSKGLNLRVERMVKWRSQPSAERAGPDATCRFGSTHCYPSTDDFALYILASLPDEVELVRVWSEFSAVMRELGRRGRRGQANRWLFRTAYPCLLPRLRHGRT